MILGLAALYGGVGAGGLTLKPIYDPHVFSLATVAGATSIAVLSFLGFDGISTLAEENRGGKNAVGRATVLSLLLVGVLFMLQTWIATDLSAGMQFTSPETAFYEIAERAGGAWLRLVTIIAVVIASAIANAMAAQAAVSRISVCDGARRQAAGDPGQGASTLQDPLCEHACGRSRLAAGGIAVCRIASTI